MPLRLALHDRRRPLTEAELAGVPPDVQAAARAAAESEGKAGYKLTLKLPSYLPVMQFAHYRGLR